MDIKWVEDFLCLAAPRSFSRPASERHSSQPALNRRIQALEAWLRAELFDRSCNPPFLTPAGQAFCPLALDIVEQVHQARHTLRRGNGMAGAPTWRATHLPVVPHNPGLA